MIETILINVDDIERVGGGAGEEGRERVRGGGEGRSERERREGRK